MTLSKNFRNLQGEELANFIEDVKLSLEDSNYLTNVYNDIKLEDERFRVTNLQYLKWLLLNNGYKVDVKYISQWEGKKAVVSH